MNQHAIVLRPAKKFRRRRPRNEREQASKTHHFRCDLRNHSQFSSDKDTLKLKLKL